MSAPVGRDDEDASYAAFELKADGKRITGQALHLGAKRFTYRIDVADLDAGHLDVEVVRE